MRTKSAKQSKPRARTLKEKAKLEREEHQAKPQLTALTLKEKTKLEDEEHKAVKANSTYYFHI